MQQIQVVTCHMMAYMVPGDSSSLPLPSAMHHSKCCICYVYSCDEHSQQTISVSQFVWQFDGYA